MSECAHCGKKTAANPLKALAAAACHFLLAYFVSRVTPDPGFVTEWAWWLWWTSMVFGSLSSLFFVVLTAIWFSDPDGYYRIN